MVSIKVLGPGCARCAEVERIARQAASVLGGDAQVEKIADFQEIMRYGILSTPGLVINETVVCSGRVPGVAEVTAWLANAMAQA